MVDTDQTTTNKNNMLFDTLFYTLQTLVGIQKVSHDTFWIWKSVTYHIVDTFRFGEGVAPRPRALSYHGASVLKSIVLFFLHFVVHFPILQNMC